MKKKKTEYVLVVSDDERWYELDVYVDGVFSHTLRRWRSVSKVGPVTVPR